MRLRGSRVASWIIIGTSEMSRSELDVQAQIRNIRSTYSKLKHYVEAIDSSMRVTSFVGSDTLELICKAVAECGSHPTLVRLFADCLQLVDDKDIFSQYSLNDIHSIYSVLVETNRYDISYWSDIAHYEYSTLDNNEQAMITAQAGIAKAGEKILELEGLLAEIG